MGTNFRAHFSPPFLFPSLRFASTHFPDSARGICHYLFPTKMWNTFYFIFRCFALRDLSKSRFPFLFFFSAAYFALVSPLGLFCQPPYYYCTRNDTLFPMQLKKREKKGEFFLPKSQKERETDCCSSKSNK